MTNLAFILIPRGIVWCFQRRERRWNTKNEIARLQSVNKQFADHFIPPNSTVRLVNATKN
jgi:hypothetical protein